jgi:hypothetical protein
MVHNDKLTFSISCGLITQSLYVYKIDEELNKKTITVINSMHFLLHPLEEHAGPSISNAGAICRRLIGFYVKVFFEFVSFPFIERDISAPIWILDSYYLYFKYSVLYYV